MLKSDFLENADFGDVCSVVEQEFSKEELYDYLFENIDNNTLNAVFQNLIKDSDIEFEKSESYEEQCRRRNESNF